MTSARDLRDRGFTLVEVVIAIVLVGILSAVVVVGVGQLTTRGTTAACSASADAARAAATTHLGSTGAYQRMKLIDKQDCVPGSTDFVHHGLDPLFELTSVLGTCDHHRQVQNDNPFLSQDLRNVTVDNSLRESFNNGRLTYPSFTQKNWVVLGASA